MNRTLLLGTFVLSLGLAGASSLPAPTALPSASPAMHADMKSEKKASKGL